MCKPINTTFISTILTFNKGEEFIKMLTNYALSDETKLNENDFDEESFIKETAKQIHPLATTEEYQNFVNNYFTKYHFELYPNKLYNLVRFGEHDINGLIVDDKMTFESDMVYYENNNIKIYSSQLETQTYLESLSTELASIHDWAFLVKTTPCIDIH